MKGKLINEDNKWFVQYKTGKFEGEYLYGQLPLHPDTFKGIAEENQGEYFVKYSGILGNISIKDYTDVEFEIVEEFKENKLWGQKGTGVYTKYAKLIIPKKGSFDEDGFGITRVIDDKQEDHFKKVKESITNSTKNSGYSVYIPEEAKKQEETTTSWYDIIKKYPKFGKESIDILNFWDWLKENYYPPVKK